MTDTIIQIATYASCFIPVIVAFVVRTELKEAGTVMNVHGKDVTVVTVYGHQITIK